jgi:hypothetical protein
VNSTGCQTAICTHHARTAAGRPIGLLTRSSIIVLSLWQCKLKKNSQWFLRNKAHVQTLCFELPENREQAGSITKETETSGEQLIGKTTGHLATESSSPSQTGRRCACWLVGLDVVRGGLPIDRYMSLATQHVKACHLKRKEKEA